MKKIKKLLCGSVALLGLGLLGSCSSANAQDVELETIDVAAITQAAEIATYASTITDAEINNYINQKEEDVLNFYKYFIKTFNWQKLVKNENFGSIYDASSDFDYSLDSMLQLKKGKAYIVSGYTQNSNGSISNDSTEFFTKLYKGLKTSITYQNGDTLDYALTDDYEYTWDNQLICSEINNRFIVKVQQAYSAFTTGYEKYKNTTPLVIIPLEDVTLTLDTTSISKYPNLNLDILVGDIDLNDDYSAPEFEGTVNLGVNVDNQPSIQEILSNIRAVDETDGLLQIQVDSSTYVQGEMIVGDYTINVSATDSAGNTAYQTIYVHRYDDTKPILSGINNYTVNYDNELTIETIKSGITITDNVDQDLALQTVSDTFSDNAHNLGTYQVIFKATDHSNNVSNNFAVTIKVENQGTAVITLPKEIRISIQKQLTLEEFKEKVSVIDGYDGVITNYSISGFSDYTASYSVVGENVISVSHRNSGNNLTSATCKIIKIDDQEPVIYFNNNYYVMLPQGQAFTEDMLKQHIAKVLSVDIADIVSVEGQWDIDTAGTYDVMVCLASGEEATFILDVGQTLSKEESKNNNFFTTAGYWKNLFNFKNYKNWNFWNWATWFILAIAIVSVCIFKYRKRRKLLRRRMSMH